MFIVYCLLYYNIWEKACTNLILIIFVFILKVYIIQVFDIQHRASSKIFFLSAS